MLSSMKGYPRGSESSSRQLINFEALKQLKHTSQEYNTLCNRIRVMEANEERNMRKAENSEQKIKKMLKVREESVESVQKLRLGRIEREEDLQLQRRKNEESKEAIEKNKKSKIEEIMEWQLGLAHQTRQEKENYRHQVALQRQSQRRHNQEKRSRVALSSILSHEKALLKCQSKVESLHEKKREDTAMLLQRQSEKRREIDDMSKLEMKIMEKYSVSQTVYQESRKKLEGMLGVIRRHRGDKTTSNSNSNQNSNYNSTLTTYQQL